MSTKNIYVDTFGTPLAFPFKLFADADEDHQDLSGTTISIIWENETTGETGVFLSATLTLRETTTAYKRYKASYTLVQDDITETGQLYNFKVRIVKVGLKKEIGTYKANIILF